MNIAAYFLLAMFTVFASGAPRQAAAPADEGTPATIEGLVRDIACPIKNHQSTATDFNLQCALDCAKKGSPLVVLTRAGEMYVPMSKNMPDTGMRMQLMPYIGKFVRITGNEFELNGTHAIVIKTIAEMKDVKLNRDLK